MCEAKAKWFSLTGFSSVGEKVFESITEVNAAVLDYKNTLLQVKFLF